MRVMTLALSIAHLMPHIKQRRKDSCHQPPPSTAGSNNNFTSRMFILPEKHAFCCKIGLGECIRCHRKRQQSAGQAQMSSSWGSSSGGSIYSNNNGNLSSSLESNSSGNSMDNSILKMKVGKWKTMVCQLNFQQSPFKNHSQIASGDMQFLLYSIQAHPPESWPAISSSRGTSELIGF